MPKQNPVSGTNKTGSKPRERVLQDSELPAIWNALGSDDYGDICRLLILTGARRDEIGSLSSRSEINLAQKQIELSSPHEGRRRSHHPAVAACSGDLAGTHTARGQRLRVWAR